MLWTNSETAIEKVTLLRQSLQCFSLSIYEGCSVQSSIRHDVAVVQLLSGIRLFSAPWTAALQASLSFTISLSLLKLMSSESVMPSKHLIFCHPFLLLPSVFPRIRVFSNELAVCIRWPKYWSFNFSISPSNEYSGLIPIRID